jgi:hypothetical protein
MRTRILEITSLSTSERMMGREILEIDEVTNASLSTGMWPAGRSTNVISKKTENQCELRTQTLMGRFHHNEPYQLSSHPITLVFGSTYLIMLFVIFFLHTQVGF